MAFSISVASSCQSTRYHPAHSASDGRTHTRRPRVSRSGSSPPCIHLRPPLQKSAGDPLCPNAGDEMHPIPMLGQSGAASGPTPDGPGVLSMIAGVGLLNLPWCCGQTGSTTARSPTTSSAGPPQGGESQPYTLPNSWRGPASPPAPVSPALLPKDPLPLHPNDHSHPPRSPLPNSPAPLPGAPPAPLPGSP